MTHFFFIHSSTSDAILSDCPSAVICHTATMCNGILWDGSTSAAVPPASTSDIVGPCNKTGGTTFGAARIEQTVLLICKLQKL